MDESLRVRIIIDDIQAKSELKSLNKETQLTGDYGNIANNVFQKLGATLTKLTGINFNNVTAGLANITRVAEGSSKALNSVIKTLNSTMRINALNRQAMSKISTSGADVFNNIFSKTTNATGMWAKSDASFKNHLKDVKSLQRAYTDLFKSLNGKDKLISKLFSDNDIKTLQKSLQGALTAAASGNREGFINALEPSKKLLENMFDKPMTLGVRFKEVLNQVKISLGKVKATIDAIPASIKAIAAALGIVIAAVKLIKNAIKVSELGDQIDKMSQKVGMSTRAYQQWAYVLERSGVEVSTLQSAMRQLTRRVDKADLFAKIGISDAKAMSAQDLFAATVSQLQKIEDSTTRARIAYEIFGGQYSELMPVLNMTNQETQALVGNYNNLNAAMNYGLVKASAQLQDSITDLKLAFQGLKNTLGAAIIPLLTEVVKWITNIIVAVNGLFSLIFGTKFSDIQEPLANVVMGDIEGATDSIDEATASVKELLYLISGFDELNRYSSNGSGGIGGVSGIGNVVNSISWDYDPSGLDLYKKDVKDIPGLFTNLWSDPRNSVFEALILPWASTLPDDVLTDWFEANSAKLPPFVQKAAADAGAKWREKFIENGWVDPEKLLEPNSEEAKKAATDLAKVVVATTNPITGGLNIFRGLKAGVDEFLRQVDEAKTKKALEPYEKLGLAIKNLRAGLKEMPAYFKRLYEKNPKIRDLVDSFEDLKEAIHFDEAKENVNKIIDEIANSDVVVAVTNTGKKIGESFSNIFKPMSDAIGNWWDNATNRTKQGAEDLVEGTEEGLSGLPAMSKGYWNNISEIFNQGGDEVFSKENWKNKAENIPAGIEEANVPQKTNSIWQEITEGWTSIFGTQDWKDKGKKAAESIAEGLNSADLNVNLNTKLDDTAKKISTAEIFTKEFWKKKFGVIPEGLKDIDLGDNPEKAANSMGKKLQEAINGVIWKFNNATGFQTMSKLLGIKEFPYLKMFANGGVVTETTLGVMGEYPGAKSNPEIITPENKMREVFEGSNGELVDVFIQCTRQIIQAISENQTEVNLDGTSLLRSVSRANNNYRLQTGQGLI